MKFEKTILCLSLGSKSEPSEKQAAQNSDLDKYGICRCLLLSFTVFIFRHEKNTLLAHLNF
jgi:hypothetical protein